MDRLAYMYVWDADHKKSFEWYSKAAELGNLDAIYSLGSAYENGEGVEKDPAKALEYYLKATSQDDDDDVKYNAICSAIKIEN